MPVSKYYSGHGDEVMASMQRQYGPKKGKSVFYATANKHKSKSEGGYSYASRSAPSGGGTRKQARKYRIREHRRTQRKRDADYARNFMRPGSKQYA